MPALDEQDNVVPLVQQIKTALVDQHISVLSDYGLDGNLPRGSDPARLVELMARDKKAVEGLTFALDGPDGVEVVAGVDPKVAAQALEAM